MTNAGSAPIVCPLSPEDYKARLTWISDLARQALRSHARRDLELEFVYAPDAADRVREMVQKEQECCAFLSFHLDEQPNEIRLTIKAPEHAREAADILFSQFLPSAEAPVGCGCC